MEKKYVRPYISTGARNALDEMHKQMKKEDRSSSIVAFFADWWSKSGDARFYREQCDSLISEVQEFCEELKKERKKNQEWKVYCAVLTCTTIASLVALAIQAA